MCLLSDLKYIWMQSKLLLVLAFRNIMNIYSSAALESCFPYKLMTWWTNWYCSQVWIIPPLKRKEKKGRETVALLHANIWGSGTAKMKLVTHKGSLPKIPEISEKSPFIDCNQFTDWPPVPFWKSLLAKEQKVVRKEWALPSFFFAEALIQ